MFGRDDVTRVTLPPYLSPMSPICTTPPSWKSLGCQNFPRFSVFLKVAVVIASARGTEDLGSNPAIVQGFKGKT
jgi:hypothetical protein